MFWLYLKKRYYVKPCASVVVSLGYLALQQLMSLAVVRLCISQSRRLLDYVMTRMDMVPPFFFIHQ